MPMELTQDMVLEKIEDLPAEKINFPSLIKLFPHIPAMSEIEAKIQEHWVLNSKRLHDKIHKEMNELEDTGNVFSLQFYLEDLLTKDYTDLIAIDL